jgi:viroplasmin and RNaseH domain-containing protein
MAEKIYAVAAGHTTGLFETWEECKAQVEGYSGARYKSFATREEAEAFLLIKVAKREPSCYYAVAVGRVPGIYETWDECHAQINRCSNKYKKCKTWDEAYRFMSHFGRYTHSDTEEGVPHTSPHVS